MFEVCSLRTCLVAFYLSRIFQKDVVYLLLRLKPEAESVLTTVLNI